MSIDLPGFADPVGDSQSCFRAVLDAMARPGTLHRAGSLLAAPPPLGPAASAVLLTLNDGETQLFLAEPFAPSWDWLEFHCGATRATGIGAAGFVVAQDLPDLRTLAAGSHEAPEDSATVIVQVAALGDGRRWRLRGPGLRGESELRVDGLPDDFAPRWAANRASFPRGVDLILCAGDMLAALPRSISVEEG